MERVGTRDNFFSLGGDSILSIQVVSRARRAGLELTTRDIFARQTVAALAAHLTAHPSAAPAVQAEQGALSGPAATTPIREWFFAHHPTAPHHFNMAVEFTPAAGTTPEELRTALAAVLAQHDALRAVFRPDGRGGWSGSCGRRRSWTPCSACASCPGRAQEATTRPRTAGPSGARPPRRRRPGSTWPRGRWSGWSPGSRHGRPPVPDGASYASCSPSTTC
ncbi:phosphopantetheine-binding protein [Streptomyces sp. AD16]|nr:phosphopantetheine-binding protein [Streptomyces sp. AD16]